MGLSIPGLTINPKDKQVLKPNTSIQFGTYGGGYGKALPITSTPAKPAGGQVLGAGTYAGGGGGGGAAAPAPQSHLNVNDVMQQAPQAPQIDFDALIRPAIEGLDAQIGPLQNQTATDIQGIQNNAVNKKASTSADFANQEATIGQAKTDQAQMGEDAANEARRQYSEIQQGLQARYGGTTGTGQFAGEIAGAQTARNISGVRTAVSKAVAGLDDKLVQVKEIGRVALQDIEDQASDQINKAKSQLELNLADIRRQKGELQMHKAELAANAVQQYQQTVNQVNANNAQFKQQLYMQQQAAEQALQQARTRASTVSQGATAEDLSSYITNAQPLIDKGFDASFSQKIPGGSATFSTPKKKADEELTNPFQ